VFYRLVGYEVVEWEIHLNEDAKWMAHIVFGWSK